MRKFVFMIKMCIRDRTFIIGTTDYNGAGMDVIGRAVAGEAEYEAFILKIIFTALTLGAGFKGGEIVPTLFVGATFGNVAGKLLGLGRCV